MSASDEEAAVVFDFLSDLQEDLDAGRHLPLGAYLSRFPGFEEAVAREYLAWRRTRAPEPVADERRVGPYRLLRELGRGGQGAVWLAEDTRIARRVALKLLDRGFVLEDARARFRREAEVIARLDHPGICRIYEADVEGDTPFLAMRYVEGESLREPIERARAGQAPHPDGLPLRPTRRADLMRLVAFFERAARALHAAHVEGVVHRDVKPGNIAVTREGEPVLLDFGLARSAADPADVLTRSGDVHGTPLYMSPEQVRGERDLDARTDVYSLGVCLYEALTLERPFGGATRLELELAILERPLPDPRQHEPSLPSELVAILATALERDRPRRYPSALEFAEDLRRLREFEPVRARPAGPWLRLRRWVRRQPVLATALLAVLLSLVGGLLLQQRALRKERRALARAEGTLLAVHSRQQVEVDPAGALALAIEAARRHVSEPTLSALYPPLFACQLERVLEAPGAYRVWDAALLPGGEALVAVDADTVRRWSFPAGEPLAATRLEGAALCRVLAAGRPGDLWLGTLEGRVGLVRGQEPVRWEQQLEGAVVWLEADPRGRLLVALSAAGDGRVLDALGELPPVRFRVPAGTHTRASFALDGRCLVLGWRSAVGFQVEPASAAGPLLVDPRDGEVLARLEGHEGALLDLAVSPEGREVASVGRDGRVLLHDLTRASTRELVRLPGEARAVDFHPQAGAGLLLVGTDEQGGGPLLVDTAWNAGVRALPGGRHTSARVAFAPDGRRAVSFSGDRRDPALHVYELGSEQPPRELRTIFPPLEVLWSPDGERLVSSGQSPYMHQWRSGNMPHACSPGRVEGLLWMGFSADGTELRCVGEDGVHVFETPLDAAVEPGRLLWSQPDEVLAAGASPDGAVLVTVGPNRMPRCIDLVERRPRLALPPLPAPARRIVVGPRGERAVALLEDGSGWLLGLDPGRAVRALGEGLGAACFHPAGGELVVGGAGGILLRFDRDGERLGEVPLHGSGAGEPAPGISVLVFRPDGHQLAVACADKSVRFLDGPDYEPRTGLERLFQPHRMHYRAGGDRLLVWGTLGSSSVRWIDVSAGKQSFFEGVRHGGRLTACTLEPLDGLVATGAEDGGVYLWDDADELRVRMLEHGAPVVALALVRLPGPGGRVRVASADAGGRLLIWPADPLPAALERRPRELEPWEWPAWSASSGGNGRRR